MAKQLNVNLAFSADTSKAKQAIMDLQTSLSKIALSNNTGIDPKKMQEASQAAKDLSLHLNNAFNADTGKLDLSKLDKSLKSTNQDLSGLSARLLSAGQSGQQAFVQLAQSISAAERPVISLNSKLDEMLTTLKNTARWQISSSILHGFMGAVQSAYGYAQDLNKSLNDIRIVTGQNIDQMTKFADRANQAAKALSATTTDYTNASLIYYQQGLSDAEVEARTNVTIKMANASGQSAEIVSDQLTAVWNNFYDGSKSLEYYADVMTALGAATASSTEEISTGLNKFAAIAETVGLSYEYSAAALATVTATTRQSADVVGTAFKTLFARLQDLELGKILDDGTSLGKYSDALFRVGINIKDANGQMKDMDQILDELGGKWNMLSKDTQVALAQTVAGTRQYTQLVALMDNWDFFQQNLGTARNSTGTLQEQADIYAESWEAARDRVRASMEAIYSDIIDDEFFIDITNGFSALLDSIDAFIDGVGGIKTILLGIGSIFLSNIAHKIQPATQELIHSFSIAFSSAEKQSKSISEKMRQTMSDVLGNKDYNLNDSSQQSLRNAIQLNAAKEKFQALEGSLTNIEKQKVQQELAILEISQEEAQAIADRVKNKKEEIALLKAEFDIEKATKDLDDQRNKEEELLRARKKAVDNGSPLIEGDKSNNLQEQIIKHSSLTDTLRAAREQYVKVLYDSFNTELELNNGSIKGLQKQYDLLQLMPDEVKEYSKSLSELALTAQNKKGTGTTLKVLKQEFAEIRKEIDLIFGDSLPKEVSEALNKATDASKFDDFVKYLKEAEKELKAAKIPAEQLGNILEKFGQGKNVQQLIKHYRELNKEQSELEKKQEALNRAVNNFNPKHEIKGIEKLVQTASGLGQVAMVAESIRSIFKSLNDDDLEPMEKLMTSLIGMSTIIPTVVNTYGNLNRVFGISEYLSRGVAAATESYVASMKDYNDSMTAEILSKKLKISLDQAELFLTQRKVAAMWNEIGAQNAETLATKLGISVDAAKILIDAKQKNLTISQALAQAGLTLARGKDVKQTQAQIFWNAILNKSIGALIFQFAAFALIIGAVVIAITAIVKAYKEMQANSPEAKFKAASEEAARMAEELDKARQAADGLRSSIDKYDSAIDKIKTLTKGTEEWRKAIEDANVEARNLIDTYNISAEDYYFDPETGLITFKDGALERAQKDADQKVRDTQAAKIAADNAKIQAQQAVNTSKAVKDGNVTVSYEYDSKSGQYLYKDNSVDNQRALNHLFENFDKFNGNFDQAWNELSPEEQKLLNALVDDTAELQALCAESRNNTKAIRENNKELIALNYSNNSAYKNSSNKGLLNDVLASEYEAAAETYYNKYKSKDKDDLAKDYLDAGLIADATTYTFDGDVIVYENSEGEEVGRVNKNSAARQLGSRQALEDQEKTIGQRSKQINAFDAEMTKNGELLASGEITYGKFMANATLAAKDANLTGDQLNQYLQKYAPRAVREQTLMASMGGLGISKDDAGAYIAGLTDEELTLAIDIAANAESKDQFFRELESGSAKALLNGYTQTASTLGEMLTNADKNQAFSTQDLNVLESDEDFIAYLSSQHKTMADLAAASYAEQYNIVQGYYSQVQGLVNENLDNTRRAYQAEKEELEAIIAYKEADSEEEKRRIAEAYSNINFSKYDSTALDDLLSQLDAVNAEIERLTEQEHKINISWDNVDSVERTMDELSGLSTMLEKDAKKVGNSYVFTAAQARKWMELYPDLFASAKVTTDGLIQLDQSKYQAYIANRQGELDAAIDAEIATLEVEKQSLLREQEQLQNQNEYYAQMLINKSAMENATAQQIIDVHDGIKEHYIQNGYDEVTAHNQALADMNVSDDQYSEAVYQYSVGNKDVIITGSEQAAMGSIDAWNIVMQSVGGNAGLFADLAAAYARGDYETASNIARQIQSAAINGGATKGQVVQVLSAYTGGQGLTKLDMSPGDYNTLTTGDYVNDKGLGDDAAGTKNLNFLNDLIAANNDRLAQITQEINSIDSQITYLEALKNMDLKNYGSTDASHGKDSKEEKELKELKEIAERYHEITREVAALSRETERLGEQTDKAYGKDRLKLMQDQAGALSEQLEKEKELLDLQTAFLTLDLQKIQGNFAIAPQIDENGNISNYTQLLQSAYDEYNAAATRYNNSSQTDADKKALEQAEKLYEKRIEYLEQYEETLDELNDQVDNINDIMSELQNMEFDKINYELELELEINESDLSRLEYYLGKMEDDFYQMTEAAVLISSKDGQYGAYLNNLKAQEEYYQKLNEDYENGNISQEQYAQGLKDTTSAIYDNLASIQELDKTMMNYYGETLAAAGEELGKYTALLDHNAEVLEHYSSIAALMGKENDYKYMAEILKGQSAVAENAYSVSKANYEMLQQQEAESEAAYKQAVAAGAGSEELELLENNWKAARDAANEAQKEMLADAENWASQLKAILENALADAAREFENNLTEGFGSFDAMNEAFERKNSLQEEYLTTTNKIYETNKLMRTAQGELDKTTNEAARRRLKQFVNETAALQDQTKLSKYELDIQQAKYDLLLAQIALEEQQSAKSTVRLQRDNEGNFSYVYTSNADAVAEAQQKFDDAQNNLYNKGLEGANGYAEKYQQTMQEMYDALTEIQENYLNGAYESEEEYQNAIANAKEHYYQKLEQYSNLYAFALTTDSRVAADAWTTEFATMTEETGKWMTAVNGYLNGTEGAFADWKSALATLKEDVVGTNLTDIKNATEAIKNESAELTKEITKDGGLIDALETEINTVAGVTEQYATLRESLLATQKGYEDLASAAENALKSMSGVAGVTGGQSGDGDTDNNFGDRYNVNDGTLSWNRILAAYNQSKNGTLNPKSYTKKELDAAEYYRTLLEQGATEEAAKKALGFDIGGYTGDWAGSYGKLAFLHKRELVLNENDTANFLASMEILERILSILDLQAASAQLGGMLVSPGLSQSATNTLEQNVHIEATFPNVQDHNEIELALGNLVNTASQYANRK